MALRVLDDGRPAIALLRRDGLPNHRRLLFSLPGATERRVPRAVARNCRSVVLPVALTGLAMWILSCGATVAGLIGPGASDPNLDLAMACASPSQETSPCDVPACFADYLKSTPSAQVSPVAKDAVATAENACRAAKQKEELARKADERKVAEERALQSARLCMAGAADCVVKSCYTGYLSEFGSSGALRAIALGEIDRAERRCNLTTKPPPSPPASAADGNYNAKSAPACGAGWQFGIRVEIHAGAISWDHKFRGTTYTWNGSVDAAGAVRASVRNSAGFTANGQYSDAAREIQMHYPPCGQEVIVLSILGVLP